MLGKIFKWGTGAAILGGGLFVTDQLYYRVVHANLPSNFVNWISMSRTRVVTYQYGVQALGVLVLLPLAAGMIGLSGKSPIKEGSGPLKA